MEFNSMQTHCIHSISFSFPFSTFSFVADTIRLHNGFLAFYDVLEVGSGFIFLHFACSLHLLLLSSIRSLYLDPASVFFSFFHKLAKDSTFYMQSNTIRAD